MRSILNNKVLPLLVLFVLSGFLIASWFRQGLIYGGGDVGLQTYDPQRIFNIATYIWWEATGPGSPTPQGLTAVPFNLMFYPLKSLGFSPLMLQAVLFFLILLMMGWGVYLMLLFIFGTSFRRYAFLGALFYLFNPYMMIQVWHRFVHSTFFIVAALPFIVIFWLTWIKKGNLLALIIFLIINFLALYGFGTIAYILTLWIFLMLITLSEILFPWIGLKNARKVIFLFSVGLLFWLVTNIWWLLPIFNIAPSFLSEQHSNEETIATLYTLGQQTVLPYSLQMINPFYLFLQADFGTSYSYIFVRFLPWIFVGVVLVGLIKGLNNRTVAGWSIIYLFVYILSKGVSSPWGYFYAFFMKYFFPLGVLRNPFEKVGVLLPLVSTILFVYGLKVIFYYLQDRLDIRIAKGLFISGFVFMIIFSWPMFTGQIFGKIEKPSFVKVPDDYVRANDWIEKDTLGYMPGNPGKILHFPLTTGESITYNWEYGYSGLEPSALFFTSSPSISHGFNLKQIDDSMKTVYKTVHDNSSDSGVVLKLLQDFNVRYIVLHKDAKWQGGEFYNPLETEKILSNLTFFESPQKFGNLSVYKISDNVFREKISVENTYDFVYPAYSADPWPLQLFKTRLVIANMQQKSDSKVESLAENILVFPSKSFSYEESSPSAVLNLVEQLVANKNYDDLWVRPLTDLQSAYKANNEVQSEEVNGWLITASKKLLDISRTLLIENKVPNEQDLNDYAFLMKKIFTSNSNTIIYYPQNKNVVDILQTHLYILRVIANREASLATDVNKIADDIRKDLINNNFISSYYIEGKDSDFLEKRAVKFQIPADSEYELILPKKAGDDRQYERYKNLDIIFDGERKTLIGIESDDFISLGKWFVKSGNHELVLPVLYSENLVLNKRENTFGEGVSILDNSIYKVETTEKNVSYLENIIDNAKGGDIYKINYLAKVESGNGVYIRVAQDTDILDQNQQISYALNQMVNQQAGSGFQEFGFTIPPLRTATSKASLMFFLLDQGQSLSKQVVLLKDIRVTKLLNDTLVFRKITQKQTQSNELIKASFKQESPVFYHGKFLIDSPSIFVFRESFHPGWKLILEKEGKEYKPNIHLMANFYANGWYIEERGEYNFRLVFEPQDMVIYGVFVAGVSYISLIGYGLVNFLKKR